MLDIKGFHSLSHRLTIENDQVIVCQALLEHKTANVELANRRFEMNVATGLFKYYVPNLVWSNDWKVSVANNIPNYSDWWSSICIMLAIESFSNCLVDLKQVWIEKLSISIKI
ncbi:hypothetical protein CEXT_88571 [Caerostris extrusa]|uniref:Uncharacterized protein n=1 Tax=Caerostris extrusa TaxID=172846 RepID=A0AAV4M9B9_CAEEX|nr:hypothetical protein CEXT_88571 [Caerostris extrusa]